MLNDHLNELNEIRDMVDALTNEQQQLLAMATFVALVQGEINEVHAELITLLILESQTARADALIEKDRNVVH